MLNISPNRSPKMSPRSTDPEKPPNPPGLRRSPRHGHSGRKQRVFRVAQHLVGFARLFELLFRGVIAGIAIRMILQRQLAIGALQFLVAGFPRNAQNLVIICFSSLWYSNPLHPFLSWLRALARWLHRLPAPDLAPRNFRIWAPSALLACLFRVGYYAHQCRPHSFSRSL